MERGAVLCLNCGFHLHNRKKVVKVYEEVNRHWETGLPRATRVALFLSSQALMVLMGVGLGLAQESPAVFIPSAMLFFGMLAFLLGTYDHLDLERDSRGRVKLTQTWFTFFVPRAPL